MNISKNNNLMKESFTSIFSLFELAKGINKRSDSEKRIKILSNLSKTDLNVINLMPFEMMKSAYVEKIYIHQSTTINEKLSSYLSENDTDSQYYEKLVSDYENDTLLFQKKIETTCVKPKPEPKTFKLNLEDLIPEPDIETPQSIKDLPKGVHFSKIAMELHKIEQAPLYYRTLFSDNSLSDEEILKIYNNKLNVFFFANFMYMLKKNSLREAASKNDWLDILHTIYLFNSDMIMVSNDNIFESILPNINIITVEDYKKLIDVNL